MPRRSVRKKTPATAIIMGDAAEIKLESIEVVLSVPRNKSPSATVESKNPFKRVIAKTLGFLGNFMPVNAKMTKATVAEIKNL